MSPWKFSTTQDGARLLCLVLGIVVSSGLPLSAGAQNAHVQHNLISDVSGLADQTDPNLANPLGIAFSASGPFWIADNHSGLSILYNSSGGIQSLVLNIPPPVGGQPPSSPMASF